MQYLASIRHTKTPRKDLRLKCSRDIDMQTLRWRHGHYRLCQSYRNCQRIWLRCGTYRMGSGISEFILYCSKCEGISVSMALVILVVLTAYYLPIFYTSHILILVVVTAKIQWEITQTTIRWVSTVSHIEQKSFFVFGNSRKKEFLTFMNGILKWNLSWRAKHLFFVSY